MRTVIVDAEGIRHKSIDHTYWKVLRTCAYGYVLEQYEGDSLVETDEPITCLKCMADPAAPVPWGS